MYWRSRSMSWMPLAVAVTMRMGAALADVGHDRGTTAPARPPRVVSERLERQAGELAELRRLTRQAESLQQVGDQERDRAERLDGELHELRVWAAATGAGRCRNSRRRWRRAAARPPPSRRARRTAQRRAVGDGRSWGG